MPKYDYPKSKALVYSCAPSTRISFFLLAEKENKPEQNLKESDFSFTPKKNVPVVDGDNLARTFVIKKVPCSMDFAFILDNNHALLGEMKFNVDRSIRGQLISLLDKFKGSYRNLYAFVSGRFHNTSFVLFNEASFEEGVSILSRLDEEFQDDDLVSALKLHFKAETLPSFSKKFF